MSENETQNRPDHNEDSVGVLTILREWGDALVIAFVLAMFVRVFVVELFKIPTGSMSPTLIGDEIAEVDINGDGLTDLVVNGHRKLVFLNRGDRFEFTEDWLVRPKDLDMWRREGLLRVEYDRILVNKFAYWFGQPDRGDVVVFKVPEIIWSPGKPIYIKRAVGLAGDRISFGGRLLLDGEPAVEPEFFRHQLYKNEVSLRGQGFAEQPFVDYGDARLGGNVSIEEVRVPEGHIYVLGDNTRSSLDSRYWGAVPDSRLKGKAFIRYWPFNKMKFIR